MTTLETEQRPAWADAAARYLAATPRRNAVLSASPHREAWYFGGGVHVLVGPHGVEVWSGPDRICEYRQANEIGDDEVSAVLRLAGVLPRLVPATDRYREGMWLAAHDGMRWTSSRGGGEAAAAAGYRRLYVEESA